MFSEQNLHKYGTSLPLLELDQVPSKKPLYVQDQIATDDQGRRRFHGAFTGGFSAGYWNTVGSKEGWTPQSFKSSRTEKATEKLSQRPEDFMDEEDRGEFGIAPKTIKINEDFTSGPEQTEKRKRKFLQNDLQPIPGEPVLQQLIRPIKDKVAVRILKTWGWRPGQGIGPRQTRKEKKKARERNKKELYLMEKYGCEMPSTSNKAAINSEDDEEEDEQSEEEEDEITFAPEDCELPPCHDKQNSYGLGYEPLSRQTVLGGNLMVKHTEHINLFQALEAIDKNNKKISFTGQAFGVGALEEDDDEDVYALDDMTRYDYTLEEKKNKKIKKKVHDADDLIFGEFILDLNPSKLPQYKVEIPFGWHPRNWYEKRSRFEPLDPRKQRHLDKMFTNTSDEQEMTRAKRAELLGEELRKKQPLAKDETPGKEIKTKSVEELQQEYKVRKEKTKSLIEKITAKSSSFTKGGIISIDDEEKPFSEEDISSAFKPFAANEQKQKRYEQFLAKEFKNEQEIEDFLKTIQPKELSLWDRKMELKEFQQAKKLYRPLKGIMSDRFITESEIKAVESETKKVENKQIVVERSKQMWKPHSLLCKRFNIAEPFKGIMDYDKKSKTKHKKMSVFDYLESSVNKKEDFQTPVIIPKTIEKPQEMVKQTIENNNTNFIRNKPDKEIQQEEAALEWQEVLNPLHKSSKDKQPFTFKPKTELEKQVVESINKPVAEKKELFKSIFSDSESEEEEDEKVTINKDTTELTTAICKPLNAAAANLLRNNSPPRGIFKALFSTSTKPNQDTEKLQDKEIQNLNETPAKNNTVSANENLKVLFKPKSVREPKEQQMDVQPTDIYGPALPKSITPSQTLARNSLKSAIDEKLLQLFNKHKPKLQVTEKWIEKDSKIDVADSEDSSKDSNSSSSSEASGKHKKKSNKSKKKKSSGEHKHKKHKDNKSSKKSRNSDKKKKKHKKK